MVKKNDCSLDYIPMDDVRGQYLKLLEKLSVGSHITLIGEINGGDLPD